MKIIVTGASGFLGQALCQQLEQAGHQVTRLSSKNADLTQQGSLNAFNHTAFDQIFHLAAWTQAGDFCLHHPGEQWIINQRINTEVLAWWQKSQPQAKLISIGTSCAYDPNLPLSEDNYMLGQPIDGLYTYAMTKRMMYAGLLALRKQYGLRFLCLVPSTLYGPGYHTDGRQMHFIFDLMRKIIRGKLYGEPVILWGDGNQSRELIFLNDFTRIACDLAKDDSVQGIVNIGAGKECTIKEFAQGICQVVGYNPQDIQYDLSRYVGAKSKCLLNAKLLQLRPGQTFTPLAEGLKISTDWLYNIIQAA